MSDLRSLMQEAASLSDHATPAVTDADLARARQALRRRRAGRMGVGSTLVAAAAVGAFAIIAPLGSPSDSADRPTAAGRPAETGIALVSYTGTQPSGYVLGKVPAGWSIRDDNPSLLTLAPEGAVQDDTADGVTSLAGTIAVMTQTDTGVPTDVALDQVQVDGRAAVIAHMKGTGDTRTLFVEQPSGAFLVIQVWDGLGWSNRQISDFAESVHITKDAQPSVG